MNFKRTLSHSKNIKNKNEVLLNDLVVKNKEIDDVDLDGEKVMMNLDKGQYFMINKVGGRIWEIIDNDIKVNDIINMLIKEYDVDEIKCKNNVIMFLQKLNQAELIKIK